MSVFLEVLRCILCCQDEYDDSDNHRYEDLSDRHSFASTYHSYQSDSKSPLKPTEWPFQHEVILGPGSSKSTSNDFAYSKTSERIYDVTQSAKNSAVLTIDSPQSSSKPPYSSLQQSSSSPSLKPSPPALSPQSSSKPPYSSLQPSSSSPSLKPSPPTLSPQSSSKPPYSSLQPSSSSPSLKPSPPTLPSKPSTFSHKEVPSSSNPPKTFSKPAMPSSSEASCPTPRNSSPKPSLLFLKSSKPSSEASSPFSASSSSSNSLPSFKPTLSQASSNLTDHKAKADSYVWVEKVASPIYTIPKNIENLIEKDIVPGVLVKLLSPTTYRDYFAALLYAEDYYIEKWNGFQLKNVTLELHKAAIYKRPKSTSISNSKKKQDKLFVAFEVDSVPEKLPFLLSRDFVFAQSLGRKVKTFQGVVYRVVKSKTLLVEFGEDFYSQHYSTCKYDISFSFNRVCLKRAHQAIAAASDPSFQSFIFPDSVSQNHMAASIPFRFHNRNLDMYQMSAVQKILSFRGSPPYLVEGPLCVTNAEDGELSRTGLIVQEVILQLCQHSRKRRILVCAPINRTCDALMRSLKDDIPESDMFRANAAFREIDGVPVDILPSCLYEGECFTCPSLQELRKYRVIFSTFMSSFRLHTEGITAEHFSHIFLVDASSATEPEAMVALANLANEKTAVVVTGAPGNSSNWVRSDIARKYGLRISYFERLRKSNPYKDLDPTFISQVLNDADDSCSIISFS